MRLWSKLKRSGWVANCFNEVVAAYLFLACAILSILCSIVALFIESHALVVVALILPIPFVILLVCAACCAQYEEWRDWFAERRKGDRPWIVWPSSRVVLRALGDGLIGVVAMLLFFALCMLVFDRPMLADPVAAAPMWGVAIAAGLFIGISSGQELRKWANEQRQQRQQQDRSDPSDPTASGRDPDS